MGARRIPRPQSGTPASADDIFDWLRYLCLNSDCRGLAGFELAGCPELLQLRAVTLVADGDDPGSRARALRELLRRLFPDTDDVRGVGSPDAATLCLLGLTRATAKQPRAVRRRLAAEAMLLNLDTFQKRYERRLLLDAAHELWRLEQQAGRDT